MGVVQLKDMPDQDGPFLEVLMVGCHRVLRRLKRSSDLGGKRCIKATLLVTMDHSSLLFTDWVCLNEN